MNTANIIGATVDRVDGRAKVTGEALYAADVAMEGLAHACGVFSTIGSGQIERIDASQAESAPGVVGVWHHENLPKLFRSPNTFEFNDRVGEVRPPFEDSVVYYAGQFVAAVVAENRVAAEAAAALVRVHYRQTKPAVSLTEGLRVHGARVPHEDDVDTRLGDPERAWASAAVRHDATYTTPVEVHNPLELHATVAVWHEDRLDVHDSTQWVVGQRNALARVLGIAPELVTVHAPYIGGGFGGKLFLWPHTVIAAVLARACGRPVKLAIDRRRAFTTVGHRAATRQRLRVATDREGRLVSMRHDTLTHSSLVDEYVESSGDTTAELYACPNVATTHRLVSLNVGTPTPMRAPGAASGMFALECALDELAIKAAIDPLELRRRNIPATHPANHRPWSSQHLGECYERAKECFGWASRSPAPGSMRDGGETIGWGMATASWPAARGSANARVQLLADGTALASIATQDIGTGTYTVIAQVVAQITGLPLDRIQVALGNSAFPEGPISGSSQVTATVVPAVAAAARQAMDRLLDLATAPEGPFADRKPSALRLFDGTIADRTGDGERISFSEVIEAARLASVDGEAQAEPGHERRRYAFRSFGAHFVEVRWDPGLAHVRVTRVVSAFDVGRIINRKTARSQIEGAIVMGLGMALLEESIYDPRRGGVVTDNLADYLLPVNLGTPHMDIILLDQPDPHMGEFGARGLGEIGITGLPAAVANAVFHATGKRIRDLPITIERLLKDNRTG